MKYEQLMRQVPGFVQESHGKLFASNEERDCPRCMYYDKTREKCGLERCSVFGE